MNRKLFIILILSIITGSASDLQALVYISVAGSWQETIDSTDLIPGPVILLPSTYTSPGDAVRIDITTTKNEKWLVYVSKSDSIWDPRMHLFLRRTSNGTGVGKISGGTSFQEISSLNQSFFSGSKGLINIAVQFQLTGISLQIPPAGYGTKVTYTITEY
jgi:hypothetical protein